MDDLSKYPADPTARVPRSARTPPSPSSATRAAIAGSPPWTSATRAAPLRTCCSGGSSRTGASSSTPMPRSWRGTTSRTWGAARSGPPRRCSATRCSTSTPWGRRRLRGPAPLLRRTPGRAHPGSRERAADRGELHRPSPRSDGRRHRRGHGAPKPDRQRGAHVHRQAFVYVVSRGRTADTAALDKLGRFRTAWESFFAAATGGRMAWTHAFAERGPHGDASVTIAAWPGPDPSRAPRGDRPRGPPLLELGRRLSPPGLRGLPARDLARHRRRSSPGGRIVAIGLTFDEGGVCITDGGSRFLILNAGYLGSLAWGVAPPGRSASHLGPSRVITAWGRFVLAVTFSTCGRSSASSTGSLAGAALLSVAGVKLSAGRRRRCSCRRSAS